MLPSPRKATLLVVEDDHALRELYRATLLAFGYAVVAVEDGVDALRYVDGQIPSLIVLDLALPRLGGRDVQRELASRAETRDIPIVVVTGTDMRDLRVRLDKNLHGFPVLILTGASLTPDEEATIARDSAYVFHKSENLESLALQLNSVTG